jgi:hypothetical protein
MNITQVGMICDSIESETTMIESKRLAYSERRLSDAVLDGLFGGLAGGIVMAVYLSAWGLVAGSGPEAVLGMFDPSERRMALSGGLTHLAVASVYGIVFGGLWWALRRGLRRSMTAWLTGALYGLALLLIARAVVLPAGGSALAEIPTLHFAIAHIAYGIVLGYVSEQIGARAQ